MTPLKDLPRADRERALNTARESLLGRYYGLREELDQVREQIKQIDSQRMILQGLELPDQGVTDGAD